MYYGITYMVVINEEIYIHRIRSYFFLHLFTNLLCIFFLFTRHTKLQLVCTQKHIHTNTYNIIIINVVFQVPTP